MAEQGSHEQFLAAKGSYAALWNAQAKYYWVSGDWGANRR